MTYYAPNVPNHVWEFIGCCRGLHLDKLSSDVFTLYSENTARALLVRAKTPNEAREAVRDFVQRVRPKTDKRRKHWVYT